MIKMDKILARLKEPSSWAGIAILALVLFNVIPAQMGMELIGTLNGVPAVIPADVVQVVAEDTGPQWGKIALNIVGSLAGIGGLGAMLLGEGGKKAIMAFAVVPLFMLSLGSSEVMAAEGEEPLYTFTVGWKAPVTRENGDVLPAEEIGGYLILVEEPGGETGFLAIEDGSITEAKYPIDSPGQYSFSIQAYDTDGLYSDPSLEPAIKIVGSPIGAVQGLTVTITCETGSSCSFSFPQRE